MTDPYVVPIPERITDKDGRPSDEFRAWLVYDNRFKHDLFQQLGLEDNTTVERQDLQVLQSLSQLNGGLAKVKSQIAELQQTPNPTNPLIHKAQKTLLDQAQNIASIESEIGGIKGQIAVLLSSIRELQQKVSTL